MFVVNRRAKREFTGSVFFLQLGGRSIGLDVAIRDNHDAIGQGIALLHEVRGQQEGFALLHGT